MIKEAPTYASILKTYLNIPKAQIGDLPNDLLIIILSFLPAKDAVKSSILSTRWRYLWKYVINLNITMRPPTVSRCCLDIENLFAAIQSSEVTKLQLSQIPDYSWRMESKIFDSVAKFSANRGVEELTFNVEKFHVIDPIFGVSTLVRLQLKNCCIMVPSFTNLPVLKTLVLISGSFVTPVEELISKCPSLESLHLDGAYFCYSETITINHLNLRSLIYRNSKKLELSTPALKWLKIKDCCNYNSGYVFKNISSLIRCELHSKELPDWMYDANALWRCLLNDLDCVKSIYLSELIFQSLWLKARENLGYYVMQSTSLILETAWACVDDIEAMTDMLSFFPRLEQLVVIFTDNILIYEDDLEVWSSLELSLSKMEKLKTVDIYGLIHGNYLHQMKPSATKVMLLEVFLMNLQALETLRICVKRKTKSNDADIKYTFSNVMESIKYLSGMTSTTIKLSILYC